MYLAVAKELHGSLEIKVWNEGERDEIVRVVSKECEGRAYEALSDLMFKLEMGMDFVHDEVYNALSGILDTDGDLDAIEENIWEYCEADVYTHDLMEWASEHWAHHEWVDEAISGGHGGETMVSNISAGQSDAKRVVWEAVIRLIRELVDEGEWEE